MMKRAVAFLLFATIGLLASGVVSRRAAAQPQLPLWVTFLFDGGYSYVYTKKKGLEVGAFKTNGEAHNHIDHSMILRLYRGTQTSGKPPDPKTQKMTETQWTLDNEDVRLASYGNAAQKGVSKPNSRDPGEAKRCDAIADFSDAANNMFFLPSMKQLSGRKIANDLTPFTARVLLDHGRIATRRVKDCWEFKSEDGGRGMRVALVPGLGALKYNLEPGGDSIELLLSPIGKTNVTGRILIKAENVKERIDGRDVERNEIMIWAGRFPDPKSYEELPYGGAMKDFKRYYRLLKDPPEEKKWLIPHKDSHASEASPGDECALAFFEQS